LSPENTILVFWMFRRCRLLQILIFFLLRAKRLIIWIIYYLT
jgi:hypothetical protein